MWRTSKNPVPAADMFWAMVMIAALLALDAGAVGHYDKLNWIGLSPAVGVALRAASAPQRRVPETRSPGQTPGHHATGKEGRSLVTPTSAPNRNS